MDLPEPGLRTTATCSPFHTLRSARSRATQLAAPWPCTFRNPPALQDTGPPGRSRANPPVHRGGLLADPQLPPRRRDQATVRMSDEHHGSSCGPEFLQDLEHHRD